MHSLYKFFDKFVQHRAWNQGFFEAVKNKYPETYSNKTYEEAFYHWQEKFDASWESLMEEPESEKVKVADIKLKGITEVLRTLMPVIDPMNRAMVIEWAKDNVNEMPDMFKTHLDLDIDAIKDYEPPTPMEMPKEPKPSEA